MKNKFVDIDFEFNNTKEEKLNLVCAALISDKGREEYWLHKNQEEKDSLHTRLLQFKNEGYVLRAWQAVAEARSVLSLEINPVPLEWIDLFLEYRCITNHNDHMMFGPQLVNGKVKKTRRPPPKWERTEEDNKKAFKPSHSLVEATFKLTGNIRDTEHKTAIRDLIISSPKGFSRSQKEAIQKYCMEDVVHMAEMWDKILAEYKRLLGTDYKFDLLFEEMLYRGKYAALTATREAKGYPINYEQTKNFSRQVPILIEECQRDINSQFPEIKPFKFNIAEKRYSWKQKETREWLEENIDTKTWMKTKGKALSLSKDAFEKFFPFRHSYPRGNFGAQILRYLKLKQSLNGFIPSGKKKTFWDSVGSDKIVRPYMNIYGSQTSRSQPAATGFIPLKPAWTRALIQPPPGKAITGIDYGSEEFFISALMSQDRNMINSYLSGDVYLAFSILAKMVPKTGTKAQYPEERGACKATVLGMSYDMTKYGLARKLTVDTGRVWTEDEAQELIDLFEESYEDFYEFKRDVQYTYEMDERLQLADGWYLWGDNDNKRSVGNYPIQGMGAAIMRKSDLLCYDAGLYVPYTLHDALYIMHDSDDLEAIDKAMTAMKEGFCYFFDDEYKELASNIRLDAETWGPDYTDGQLLVTPAGLKIKAENIHIDERAAEEYNTFSKYFEIDDLDLF